MKQSNLTLKEWMDDRRLKASDVCNALQVSEQTIHQWRSYGVPARRQPHVERYMAEWVDPSTNPLPVSTDNNILRIEFDDAELDAVSEAAAIVNSPIRDFVRRAAVHQARAETAKANEPVEGLKLIDEPERYPVRKNGKK